MTHLCYLQFTTFQQFLDPLQGFVPLTQDSQRVKPQLQTQYRANLHELMFYDVKKIDSSKRQTKKCDIMINVITCSRIIFEQQLSFYYSLSER